MTVLRLNCNNVYFNNLRLDFTKQDATKYMSRLYCKSTCQRKIRFLGLIEKFTFSRLFRIKEVLDR